MNRFENGFDSFKKAIFELENRNENEFELKAIITDFHHAIEVLFKHILYLKEKYLIYKNMNDWINVGFDRKLGKINNQNKNTDYTITFDEAVRRVINIYDVQIDQYTYNGFLSLCKLRNSLTHDEVELDKHTVEQIVVNLTPIVTAILQKYLINDEKTQFDDFIESEKYQKILRQLIGNNLEWRIVTISNLLELYSSKDYDSLSRNEIKHLELTLSTLNVGVYDEELLCNIDNEYYVTYVSYLQQNICDLLILHFAEIKINDSIKKLIKRTKIIEDILRKYLINATLYVYGLVNNERYISFVKKEKIHEILDRNSFVNNNDIFSILECIGKIIEVLVMITGTKKRKELLENIFLGGGDNDTVELVYSTLLSWFSKNGWYNSISLKDLDEDILNEIESGRVSDEVYHKIWDNELYQRFIGEFGEWGTVDRIDHVTVEELKTIVKSEDKYTLVYDVSLDTQTYSDHEYYNNGSKECFIKVTGCMEDGRFELDEAEYLGEAIGFRSFIFD